MARLSLVYLSTIGTLRTHDDGRASRAAAEDDAVLASDSELRAAGGYVASKVWNMRQEHLQSHAKSTCA